MEARRVSVIVKHFKLSRAYNERVKIFLKSLGFGVMGAGLFFGFFSMLVFSVLSAWTRMHQENPSVRGVMIEPLPALQYIGIPLAAATFLVCCWLGHKKFSRAERHP